MYDYLPTPAVVMELDIMEENVRDMYEHAKACNIAVRPHIKPHKSIEIAKMQIKNGASGITCAKIGEAEIMAQAGIKDILIAFPIIGEDKLKRLGELLKKTNVCTIINSVEGAQGLSDLGEKIGKKIQVLIEVDGGIRRGGRKPGMDTVDFARDVKNMKGIEIKGILYYGGTIYEARDREGIIEKTRMEQKEMTETAAMLEKEGLCMEILSGGSSYSSKCPEYMNGITEVRPGHYIFNDCGQLAKGFSKEENCALRVVASVVCITDSNHAIIDAGSKALTTDGQVGCMGYGHVIGRDDIVITKLNEEHGFLESKKGIDLKIGDKIAIIPNHACVVPNLVDQAYGIRNGVLDHMVTIDARGKNQ